MLYILLGLAFMIVILLVILYPLIMRHTVEAATIRIPSGATEKNVTDTLTKYYGDSFAGSVMKLVKLRKTDLSSRHGSYEIGAGSNALSVARRISSGGQTPVRITINGFRDLDLLCERIAAKMDFSAADFKACLSDPATFAPYGLTPVQALAIFVDDSYQIYWSATPGEVIDKIGKNYLNVWNPERRRKAGELGLTPAEVMILSSIVDEESNATEEKGTIGRLYINRLDKGMRLQSDPTVRFAVGDFTIRRIKGEHLKVDSPYNTYTHNGLPPGPIRTTGVGTIDLILDSTPNNYLYMCAKEDFSGTHNFATTFEEHSKNARKYREALNARNIY